MPNNPAKSYFKFKTQRVIAIASLLIFIGKITAYLITSSVGILTDALESTVNVATGFTLCMPSISRSSPKIAIILSGTAKPSFCLPPSRVF